VSKIMAKAEANPVIRGPIGRDEVNGRFVKGNASGGRKPIPANIREMALAACPQAINYAIEVLTSPDEPTKYRLTAAETLMDRGLGKAPQSINNSVDGKLLIEFINNWRESGNG
jgi:hypothetical protein